MRGIVTQYAGATFRSMLEARWASFFDLIGWPWHYEPFELPGWIPDFLVSGSCGSVLVEVKPLSLLPFRQNPNNEVAKKIERACLDTEWEVLVLGCGPEFCTDHHFQGGVQIGWIAELTENLNLGALGLSWDAALVGCHCGDWTPGDPLDVGAAFGSYIGRLHGNYDGNPMACRDPKDVIRLFRESGATTQWKPRT